MFVKPKRGEGIGLVFVGVKNWTPLPNIPGSAPVPAYFIATPYKGFSIT